MQPQDVINNINIISEKLFKSIEGEVYVLLDKIINISTTLFNEEPLKNIISDSKIGSIVIIANSFILFYIIYYIFSQLISMYNGKSTQRIHVFILRIIIVSILVNFSFYICKEIINIFSMFSDCINQFIYEITKQECSFENLKETIISMQDFMKQDLISLNGIIKGLISFGIVSILINFSIRYVTVIFLVIISPFAFITLASPLTSGIFKSWGKLLVVNLLIQVVVKFVILIPISYKNTSDLMYKIILVGTIYILYKINNFTKELFVKITSQIKYKNIFNGDM